MSNKYPNLIRWADWLDNIYPGQEGNNDESESVQFLLHFCSDEDARIAMMCEPFFKSLDEIAEANNVTVEEIASTLEEMSMKGLIMCSSLSGVLKYRRWPWLPGILEFVVLDKEIDPELLKYASDFYEERINKIDVLPYFDFNMDKVREFAHKRNPDIEIFPISAKTGEGVDAWCNWLEAQVRAWNE